MKTENRVKANEDAGQNRMDISGGQPPLLFNAKRERRSHF